MSKRREQQYKQFARNLVSTDLDHRVPKLPPNDCLERIATMGPCLLECYGDDVRVDDIESSLYNRSDLYDQRLHGFNPDGQRGPGLPHLWIMTMCRPRNVMREYEAEPMAGWPTGFFTLRREQRLYLVTLPALPRTPETLTLRLMGDEVMHELAMQHHAALPPDSPLARMLGPLLETARRDSEAQQPSKERTKGDAINDVWSTDDRLKDRPIDRGRTQRLEKRLKERFDEGFEEGLKEGLAWALLRLLERRFGALADAVTARVMKSSATDIERLLDRAVDAATLDDLFTR
jgi:hypothetical protein